jgi:transposase-like protein
VTTAWYHGPMPDHTDPVCPSCGRTMKCMGKSTVTGRAVREYWCEACQKLCFVDEGEALWSALEKEKAKSSE